MPPVGSPILFDLIGFQPEPVGSPILFDLIGFQPEPVGSPILFDQVGFQPEPVGSPILFDLIDFQPNPVGSPILFDVLGQQIKTGPFVRVKDLLMDEPLPAFFTTVGGLPSAVGLLSHYAYVTDEVGGPTLVFSDDVNWLRFRDRVVASS